jgi:hypothetical protein
VGGNVSDFNDLTTWVQRSPWHGHLEVVKANAPIYHVSHNKKINRFIPTIGHRQAADEDRSIPRVCCATTLLGCFKGHMAIETQFHQKHGTTKKDAAFDIAYEGGWKVYAFHPEAYLVPDTLLLHDGYKSGEVWLTSYNKNTHFYTGEVAATCFYEMIQYRARSGSNPIPHGVLFVEVTAAKLQFSPRHLLSKGHWRILGPTQQGVRSFEDDANFKCEQITESQYLEAKHGAADMLAYQEPEPVFLNWK